MSPWRPFVFKCMSSFAILDILSWMSRIGFEIIIIIGKFSFQRYQIYYCACSGSQQIAALRKLPKSGPRQAGQKTFTRSPRQRSGWYSPRVRTPHTHYSGKHKHVDCVLEGLFYQKYVFSCNIKAWRKRYEGGKTVYFRIFLRVMTLRTMGVGSATYRNKFAIFLE